MSITQEEFKKLGINDLEKLKFVLDSNGNVCVRGFGVKGDKGESVLNGTVDPTTEGVDGDFYINTTSWQIFGPKTGGVWGNGTNLQGQLQTVVGGSNISIDNTDPNNPIINFSLGTDENFVTDTEKTAIGTIGGKEDVSNKSTNITTDGSSDTKYPSVKAVKDYADSLVVGLWDDRGSFDASSGAYPSTGGSGTAGAILKGDIWTISVAGTLPTGQVVEKGDTIRALIDTPGNTQVNWAIQQNNIGYTAENSTNKKTTMTGNESSNVFYLSAKAIYDWAKGLFVQLTGDQTISGNKTFSGVIKGQGGVNVGLYSNNPVISFDHSKNGDDFALGANFDEGRFFLEHYNHGLALQVKDTLTQLGNSSNLSLNILSNGNVGIKTNPLNNIGLTVDGDIWAKDGRNVITGDCLLRASDTDGAAINVNYFSARNDGSLGNTQFRNFEIYNGKYDIIAKFQGSNGATYLQTVAPDIDNSRYCGLASNRWASIWAANGTIQTSDRRQKTEIKETELGLDFISKLNPVSYKWISGGNIVEYEEVEVEKEVQETKIVTYKEPVIELVDGKYIQKEIEKTREELVFDTVDLFNEQGEIIGQHQIPKMTTKLIKERKEVIKSKPGSRNHFGFIAQEVEEALAGTDFGGLVIDENGQYALRYDQFISPLVSAVKELKSRVEFLENK